MDGLKRKTEQRDWLPRHTAEAITAALTKRGITLDDIRDGVRADITNDGELRSIYLLLTDSVLVLAVSDRRNDMLFSGATPSKSSLYLPPEGIEQVYTYALNRLSQPKIVNQVVGGLFVVDVDGTETWLCRFSSARMRAMRDFCQMLDCRIRGTEPPPQKQEEREFCPQCGQPYPERGRNVCPKCMVKRAIFFRILAYFREYKARIAVMLVCMAVSGLLSSVAPYLTGTVLYDQVLSKNTALPAWLVSVSSGGNFGLALLWLVVTAALLKLLQQSVSVIQGRMTAYLVPGVVSKIKSAVFASLQKLSIGFYTKRQTGSLMQRVNGDANEVMGFFIDGLPFLIYNLLMFSFSAIIMIWLDWRLALASLVLLPPLFAVSYRLMPRLWHAHSRRSQTVRSLYSVLNDGITGARVVKAFGQQDYENRRFAKANEYVRTAEIQVTRYGNQFDIAYQLAQQVPTLLVWCLGGLLIVSSGGIFTYGKLITFVNYLALMQGPMQFFSSIFRWWTNSMNAAQRIFEIIDAQPDVVESERPLHIDIQGNVVLEHVSFGYEPNKPVLNDVSFTVESGKMLGIVGKSGAGKSTLVNIISRLYDAESGRVLLDGVDVKDISFTSLRGAVAMVSQETYIFMGTIAENIAYAKPDATRQEIVKAAQAASAHSFICRLPDGYDTVIGTGGRELSGGERQRLSIARAILANPRILVLDEATASVDTETERAIQRSLEQLIQGRTTIAIAHRLSTLRHADTLIVLENGRLVENGTHSELVAKRGVYYKLLQLQSKALAMRGIGD